MSVELPSPGWYDDRRGNYMRWWDGRNWTREAKLIPGYSPAMTQPSPQPISGLETFGHLVLTVTTSGLWGFVWYHRHKYGRTEASKVIGPHPGDPNETIKEVTVTCRSCRGKGDHWEIRGVTRVWVTCSPYQRDFVKTRRPPPLPTQLITTDRVGNR